MPCPFFEPQQRAASPTYAHARLPLIEEWDGLCHARTPAQPLPEEARFRCCNHGYSQSECARFPPEDPRSAMRYTVVRESAGMLYVLCIEERDHLPTPRATIEFDVASSELSASDLNFVVQAQALAFCRSYAKRFLRTSSCEH